MISLKHAHAIPQAISLALGVCFATVLVLGSPTKAQAASTGCNALNGGGGDTVIPAGGSTMGTVTISETLDAGEKLVITITGNPNSVRIGTNPGNALVSAQAGNLNLTITLTAGITGITISGGAGAGANTVITLRCMSSTTAVDTPSSTEPTPEETSDAVENSTTAVNTTRLPTTPNGLPGVSDKELRELEEAGADPEYIQQLEDDRARQQDELYEQLGTRVPEIDNEIRETENELWELIAVVDPDYVGPTGASYVESNADLDVNVPLYVPETIFNPQALEALEARLAEAGLLEQYQIVASELRKLYSERNNAETMREDIRNENASRAIGNAKPDPYGVRNIGSPFFTGNSEGGGFNFNVNLSTDMLRHWAQANLNETGAPETVLPPLTIAGKPVNIWIRGRGTIFDAQNRFGNDGWAGHLLTGIAMKANDRITVGAFGSYLTSDTETAFNNSEIESHSAGGGAYVNMQIVDSVSAGLSFNHERGEQDIKIGTTTGSADTQLTAVGASLQGSWYVDPVFLSPSVSVSYSDYIRDQYTDSTGTLIPSSRSRDTTIAAAATATRTFNFEEGGWFTAASPRLSASLNYYARENRSLRVSAAQIIDLEKWGGNVGTGVTLATKGNSTISIDLGVIGIGQDTLGYTGQLQVDFGF